MPSFAGFDSYAYPGDDVLTWLSANTNLEWCGYYLAPTPSHREASWMGNLAKLKAGGWGIAPLYLGEQVIPPGSQHASAAKGTEDGADAATLMTSEGFVNGSCVYLDLENGLPFPQSLQDYTAAWCEAVQENGFTPGVYCSHALALQVHTLFPGARVWAFRVNTVTPHPVPNPYPDPSPSGCGYIGAHMWQLGQYCQLSILGTAGKILETDLSSSILQDPSAPDPSAPGAV